MARLRHARALILVAATLPGPAALQAQPAPGRAPAGEVYLVPFSHLDLFWGGTREECLARGNQIIAKAIQLARQYPEFRFLIEDNIFLANYVETHPGSAELEDLKRLVKDGRVEIAPKWVGIFQNIPHGEAHVRNFAIGKRYARTIFGVDPQVAHLGDLPGYTPQFPQIAAKSGVPFMVMTRMGPDDKSLFYWKSPDGSKALLWHTISHYGWGSRLGLHRDMDAAAKEKMQRELEQIRATIDGPIFMSWGSDLWAPTAKLIENVNALNRETRSAGLRFGTPTEFFQSAVKTPKIPEVTGEIPSSWPNVFSSLAHMWPLTLPATNMLLTAEKFAAINHALGYAAYPQQEFEFLWRKLIESMDHNHDGQGGKIGDDRKIEYSQLSLIRGGEILRDRLRNIAERVELSFPRSHPIVVFNPLGWKRDDVVKVHVTLYGPVAPSQIEDYKQGMRLADETGRAIPFHVEEYSENISRALELTFVARDVPSLGYRTYYLLPAERPESFPPASVVTLDAELDRKNPRRPMGADVIENEYYRVTVDKPTGRVTVFDKELNRDVVQGAEIVAVEERGGNYIGIEPLSGRTIVNSIDRVSLAENNGVRTVLTIAGRIADIPIMQRYILYRGLKRVDVENTVQWTGPRFVRVQQLFPYADAQARIYYGIPYGAQAAGDLMPNTGPDAPDEIKRESWLQARQVLDWIFAGTPEGGLTIGSAHQLFKLDGAIRAEMLRGTRYTSVRVVRGEEITSLFYPPPDTYNFRFSLSSGRGDWRAARSHQAGMSATNPLVAVSVLDEVSRKSLPSTHSFCSLGADNLVISALKKSDSDSSLLLRFYETQGRPAAAPVELLGRRRGFREVNLLEEDLKKPEQQTAEVGPYEIKTIKLRLEP